ncbi:hypothetical protein MUO32_00205 [Shinella sp. CPCC 101442]|uniref:hypothetical protein n=1 Tax=Shinella sp. CPCC 101442 TaxID=2932265 RepID=UPI00215310AC|nr:hypothetical protein [Shinella sp. CPCC 101442]MCR6497441.1 hypothetical protein [Shinella sp. CPCC 101442]
MNIPDIYDPQELGLRQQMAAARRQRESARLALLANLVDAQRRADGLQRWISAYARPVDDSSHPELGRMVEWVAAQINDLEHVLGPDRISETLRARALFPDVDPLDDPKGEPPRHRIWGHSAALRYVNAV